MNFSDSEKPIVLRFVPFMQQEQERRERESSGYACSGPGGIMLYVNGIPRERRYCPSCKPLRRQPHRCKLAPGGVDVERYWRVRNQMYARAKEIVMAKKLSDIARIRRDYAEAHPYRAGYRISEYRSGWKRDVDVEYYALDGVVYLNVKGDRRSPTQDEVREIRSAFSVPDGAVCKMPEKEREDGKWIAKMEWQTVKQMVLA